MNASHFLPAHFWPLLALCLLAFLVLWWIVLASGRFARRRALRARLEAFGMPEPAPGSPELAQMQQAIARSRQALSPPSDRRDVRNPLYAVPWFIFLGDASADVPGLLAAAREPAAPQQRSPEDDAFWHWRSLRSMIAIEIAPTVLADPEDAIAHGQWFRSLASLAEWRERLPLNGIVVCASATRLLADAQAIRACAKRLRELIDEATAHLCIHLPVYVVVTGLEQLEGYEAFRAALPEPVTKQALGHRLADDATPGFAADTYLDGLFGEVTARMHALRMALLRERSDPAQRQAIHAFVEQVRALQPGLRVLASGMFGNSGPRPVQWRGLFLAAGASGTGGPAFVFDLFDRFLPADQPLAGSWIPGGPLSGYFAPTRF